LRCGAVVGGCERRIYLYHNKRSQVLAINQGLDLISIVDTDGFYWSIDAMMALMVVVIRYTIEIMIDVTLAI